MISKLIMPKTVILGTFEKSIDLSSEQKKKYSETYIKIKKLTEIDVVGTLRAEILKFGILYIR